MRYYLPYMELLRKKFPASLREIRAAGFDGIECHLIGDLLSNARVPDLRREAADTGLAVRFHQGWSWTTGQRNLYNMILRPLGMLVPSRMLLEHQVWNAGGDEVVVYGNTITEPRGNNYMYQTASEHVNGKAYAMSFAGFCREVAVQRVSVVFDTQHAMEWQRNLLSVEGLPSNTRDLLVLMLSTWRPFGNLVHEIHLNDFNPRLGASRGRNVFLGTGVFPLEEFCQMIRAEGWDGIVTPEVAPQHLRKPGRLRQLKEITQELMEG